MKAKILAIIAFLVVFLVFSSGCTMRETQNFWDYFLPEKEPPDANIPDAYYELELGFSSSSDVLMLLPQTKFELLSHSESVAASWGINKRTNRMWLTMVRFGDEDLSVNRKYFFSVDERPKGFPFKHKTYMRFNTEMEMDSSILNEPYADGGAKKLAILNRAVENIREDIREVEDDNDKIGICGMIINETFEGILYTLKKSPALTSKLGHLNGLDFDHENFDEGKIRMVIRGNVVKITILCGGIIKDFDELEYVREM